VSITYHAAPDLDERVREIARLLELAHVDGRVRCVRSRGSRARWTVARCHVMPPPLKAALGIEMSRLDPGPADAPPRRSAHKAARLREPGGI